MLTNSTFKILTIAAFVAYNVASVGFSYRAGQQSVNSKYLNQLNENIETSLAQEREAMIIYDDLAQKYSKSREKHAQALKTIKQEIDTYVQTTDDTCRISESGVQLINELIDSANAAIYPADD